MPRAVIQHGMISAAQKVRLRRGYCAILEARVRASTTEQRHVLRARIVLAAAAGHTTRQIGRDLDTTPTTVSLWRIRYAQEGLDGLEDRDRGGPPALYGEATDAAIRKVLDAPPPKGFARWSGPLIADALGNVDVNTCGGRCASRRSSGGRARAGARATIRTLPPRPADVVRLSLAPPKSAFFLCVDEKPSIQALERREAT